MSKKNWEKPKLIVLVRGGQEESVLVNCKTGSFVDPPSTTDIDSCWRDAGGCPANCDTIVSA